MGHYSVGLTFEIDPDLPPARETLHDALAAIRCIEVEAPHSEAAELYVDLIREALEQAGS